MDENRFVEFLRSEFPFKKGSGIGDDSSIVKIDKGFQLITKDVLIEGVHFDTSWFSPEEIAARALGVNLSDIAAMGGRPEYFFLGLGFPGHYKGEKLERFFMSLKKECQIWDVELAGGDLSASPDNLFISITMVGTAENPVRRDGALSGDLIGISRATGGSAVGLELLKKGVDIPFYSGKHKYPDPEIDKGIIFSKYVNSMIDISDGLMIDLGRIMSASGSAGCIDYGNIPVSDDMKEVCRKYDLDVTGLVLTGGEDFSLLFTITPENQKILAQTGIVFYIIGEVKDGFGVRAEHNGELVQLMVPGFDHFR